MERILIYKNLVFGFLTWLIPFAFSLSFFDSQGELKVSFEFFKSLMTVVASVNVSICLYLYFQSVLRNFLLNGIIVGLSWVAINLILDLFIMVPMMNDSYINYFKSFGILYAIYPVVSTTIGALLKHQAKVHAN